MWNWTAKPSDCVFLDFETQSLVNIRKDGGRKYVHDPSTRISLTGLMHEDRRTMWVQPGTTPEGIKAPDGWELHLDKAPPNWLLNAISQGATLCAHNALEFDEPVWRKCIGIDAKWVDCMPFCRAAGLPGSLDKACQALFSRSKHQAYGLLNMLCTAKVSGGSVQYPMATVAAWNAFIANCCVDV